MSRQRIAAALTALLMTGALLSACLVLSLYAGHRCHDGPCPVCREPEACAEQSQAARTDVSASPLAALTPVVRRETFRAVAPAHSSQTLVTWKVKRSD